MELEERTKSLHMEHKNHLASLMMNNAKSSIASGQTPDPYNGAKAINIDDELANSAQSQKKEESPKKEEPPSKKLNTGRWSADEHKRFLNGLDQFGTGNWKKITDMVGTRSCTQIRTHAQKYFIALQKPQNDEVGYARKKSKMLVGAEHHIHAHAHAAGLKKNASGIITSYGVGGNRLHHGLAGTMGVAAKAAAARAGGLKAFWGSDSHNAGLTGMEVLAQAAITGEKGIGGVVQDHYESSLDKAVAELRKKMTSEADAAILANNARGGSSSDTDALIKPNLAASSLEAAKGMGEAGNKRKMDAVAAMFDEHKKLKESDLAAAVKDTIDRKDVLNRIQAVAERQEFLRLRQEVKTLNQTIIQLQQASIESDNRVMEAITDRRLTLNECKHLREINAQLKAELHRMVLLMEHSGGANGNSAMMAAATQGANVELMQARLNESELRYHTVTESLSRQTGVLTDQHRAILELNGQLEKERAMRQRLEIELRELKKAKSS